MKKNNSFVLRNIFDKKVLVPIKANEVGDEPILLNDVGADIWIESDNADNISKLVGVISKKYNLHDGSIEQQAVLDFINNLIELKLVFI